MCRKFFFSRAINGVWLLLLGMPMTGCENGNDGVEPVTRVVVEQPCDVGTHCVIATDDFSFFLHIPEGARVLQPFSVLVEIPSEQGVSAVSAVFSMKGMQMGRNHYQFIKQADSRWRAEVILPVCVSGRTDWLAEFEFHPAGRRVQLLVPFVIDK